jgi:hypothetical protein
MVTTGPVLPESKLNAVQILRDVTGRVDRNDPAFTDPIMIDYLNAFLQQEHPQEVRIFQNQTWWDFTIDPTTLNPLPVDLDALGFSTINAPAYISYANPALNPNTFRLFWYENPADFYYRWPWANVFTPQMPTYVLYYNNELTFRGPPDQSYNVRISAYKIDYSFAGGSNTNQGSILTNVPNAYLTRYLAYGAALDILSDFGEMDKYNEVFQVYRRYRGQVLARTWDQLSSQRTEPDF